MNLFYEEAGVTIYMGDALTCLGKLSDESVHCCVTSPPYWGLRSYSTKPQTWGGDPECSHSWRVIVKHRSAGGPQVPHSKWPACESVAVAQQDSGSDVCSGCGAWRGELGLEPTAELYVEHLVLIFREIRRVLRDDGTLWLNLGDSYYGGNKGNSGPLRPGDKQATNVGSWGTRRRDTGTLSPTRAGGCPELKSKDLIGIPWRVAFALQADGWYLRSDIIWAKPGPMPESVTDRPTRSHEYIFLLAKAERYYYDHEAIKEPSVAGHGSGNGYKRQSRLTYLDKNGARGSDQPWKPQGKHSSQHPQSSGRRITENVAAARAAGGEHDSPFGDTRNKRDVWTVNTDPFPEAHFAVFPPALILPCILAGCPPAGTVLDPFSGAGTTALVAKENGRKSIGIELNEDYVKMSERRLCQGHLFGEQDEISEEVMERREAVNGD